MDVYTLHSDLHSLEASFLFISVFFLAYFLPSFGLVGFLAGVDLDIQLHRQVTVYILAEGTSCSGDGGFVNLWGHMWVYIMCALLRWSLGFFFSALSQLIWGKGGGDDEVMTMAWACLGEANSLPLFLSEFVTYFLTSQVIDKYVLELCCHDFSLFQH